MIAEIIRYPHRHDVIGIKPLYGSADLNAIWESMYDCGFNNMTIGCANGYENVLNLYTDPIPTLVYHKSQGSAWDYDKDNLPAGYNEGDI